MSIAPYVHGDNEEQRRSSYSLADAEKGFKREDFDLIAEAIPEFEDPNWDKDAAIAGVLGTIPMHNPLIPHSDGLTRGRFTIS